MSRFNPPPLDEPPHDPAGNVARFIGGFFVGFFGLPFALGACLTQAAGGFGMLITALALIFAVVMIIRGIRQRREANVGRHFYVGLATGICTLLLLFGVCFVVIIGASNNFH